MTPHPFAATLKKAKAQGYQSLTDEELWQWHADIYAFRRVRLFVNEREKNSPLDSDGKYFDKDRIALVMDWYRIRERELREFRATPEGRAA